MNNSLFSRGLNFHGQCGLGRAIKYSLNQFRQVNIPNDILSVHTNQGHTFVLSTDRKKVYYFGFYWDTRSFLRSASAFQYMPRFITIISSLWPPLRNYPHSPSILHEFDDEIIQLEVGGAFAVALTKSGRAYSIGDNAWVIKYYIDPISSSLQ